LIGLVYLWKKFFAASNTPETTPSAPVEVVTMSVTTQTNLNARNDQHFTLDSEDETTPLLPQTQESHPQQQQHIVISGIFKEAKIFFSNIFEVISL
jgi:hypothetical protein